MSWYWYLVIAGGVILILLLIALFGNSKIKKYAYQLVVNAEKLVGSGNGQEKYDLVIKKLSELTKGMIPEAWLKAAANWAVKRMKVLLEENTESAEKHLTEVSNNETIQNSGE